MRPFLSFFRLFDFYSTRNCLHKNGEMCQKVQISSSMTGLQWHSVPWDGEMVTRPRKCKMALIVLDHLTSSRTSLATRPTSLSQTKKEFLIMNNEVHAQACAKFFDHYLRILMKYCVCGADRRRRRKIFKNWLFFCSF